MDAKEAVKQEQRLIKEVFTTEAGQKLLTQLAHQYIWSKQLTGDTDELIARIAVQEIVTHFINCTNAEIADDE